MAFPTTPDHKPDCHRPPPVERATLPMGDVIVQCRECKTRWAIRPQATAPVAVPPVAEPTPAATGYVCRVHHTQPVTWRGTGCTFCARKTQTRKASQPRDYEMEQYA